MRVRDHLYHKIVIEENARMNVYNTDKDKTISIILDMVDNNGKGVVMKPVSIYTKYVVLIDWKLFYLSSLFSAVFSNLQVEKCLSAIFEGNPPAVEAQYPHLHLHAFTVAAIGQHSKLSSVYYLLKQYPQVINYYVTVPSNSTKVERHIQKKQKLN